MVERNRKVSIGIMKIAIWGTGSLAADLIERNEGRYEILYAVDNDISKVGSTINGVDIMSPEQFQCIYSQLDGILVAVIDLSARKDVLAKIRRCKNLKVGLFNNVISSEINHMIDEICWFPLGEKAVFPYLEVNITDTCNLNCRGCSHFSNLFDVVENNYSISELTNDLKKISDEAYVARLRLLGGEPLLYEHIIECMVTARQCFPQTGIDIVTNGILLRKMGNEFFEAAEKYHIRFDISQYPPVSVLKESIEQLLMQYNLEYIFKGEINEFLRFINLDGLSNCEKAYRKCINNHCLFLRKGRLYLCPTEGLIYKFIETYELENRINLDMNRVGYDIYDDIDWIELMDMLSRPIDLCRYCSEDYGRSTSWGVSVRPSMEEWLA